MMAASASGRSVQRKKIKTRISCPPKFVLTKIDEAAAHQQHTLTNQLYPCLPVVVNDDEIPAVPPPTYSDSESFYSGTTYTRKSIVKPSAPELNQE